MGAQPVATQAAMQEPTLALQKGIVLGILAPGGKFSKREAGSKECSIDKSTATRVSRNVGKLN